MPGITSVCSYSSQRATSAWPNASSGRKGVPEARYQRIAFDSISVRPSSSWSTGVERNGFSAANSSVSVSPSKMSMATRSYSRPSCASRRRTLKQFADAT